MHFDPVPSQRASAHEPQALTAGELIDPEERDEEDGPPARVREGLPPAFRMRHGRHYVEQLMGDAPLRTVREIAVADIDAVVDDHGDIAALESSIRALGVLEPLLVRQTGRRYGLIAGAQRLRAAGRVGLRTVPCIVHDVDDETLRNMQEAAARKVLPAPPAPSGPAEPSKETPLPPAFLDVTTGLEFVSALMPAITAAGDDPFRWSILTRLASVELLRARTVAVAAEILAQPRDPARTSVRTADLIETVLADVSPEARLRGVRVDVSGLDPAYTMALDSRLVRCALSGLLQSMLALVKGDGAVVQVRVTGTTIRPALIVEVAQDAVDVDPDAVQRFFEGDWREHPCGASGALRLAAAARTARLHGGRVDVKAVSPRGCAVTFVIPRPLD